VVDAGALAKGCVKTEKSFLEESTLLLRMAGGEKASLKTDESFFEESMLLLKVLGATKF
jgi:hypothetical protein